MILKVNTVTKYLFLFSTLLFIVEITAQRSPLDLRRPKGSQDMMIALTVMVEVKLSQRSQ